MRTLEPKLARKRIKAGTVKASESPAASRRAALALVPDPENRRAKNDPPGRPYAAEAFQLADHERAVIEAALAILRAKMRAPAASARSPSAARDLVRLHFAGLAIEVFAVMYLDAQLGLITFEDSSRGTLTQAGVYPREIVRAALRHNAHAVVLAHNHPSGNATPSEADRVLTKALKAALALVDVHVVDHLVVAGDQVESFAEQGIL